jgi:hypothetical protein
VSQGAEKKLGSGKTMPERSFKIGQNRFNIRFDCRHPLDSLFVAHFRKFQLPAPKTSF